MEWFDELVTLVLLLSLVLGSGFVGASLVLNDSGIKDGLRYLADGEPEFSGEKIVFTGEQLRSVSEVYRDVETEYGWCLRVDGNRVSKLDHFRTLNYTTEESIRFGCSDTLHNGRMHTHTLNFGTVHLSEQDKETLRSVSRVDVSCVVADSVERGVEKNPAGLACYSVGESGEIQRLEIRVEAAG